MLEAIKKIFAPKTGVKKSFNYQQPLMDKVIEENRHALSLVNNWIDAAAFEKSFFKYGVPDYIKIHLNKPINKSVTYTDIMAYILKKHFEELNYLEIGVSVGKNFFQLLESTNNATFTGFDIEEITPVIERRLIFKEKSEWETPVKSIKKTKSSFKKFDYKGLEVNYLCADVWDENSWAKLKGNKYNLVFSDALHTADAILFEFEMLVKYELLDEKFVIVWDDLVGKMRNSFFKIIKKYDQKYQIQDIYLLAVNGWIGENETPHSLGIISNFLL
jgi:hypothetical protein